MIGALCRILLALALGIPVWSQSLEGLSIPPRDISTLAEPPIPEDPLELVVGNAEPIQDASQRAAVINLLAKARALSDVRAQPYDLKTTFTAFGTQNSDGVWQMENAASGGVYRWSAQGPGFSISNLRKDKLLYSSRPAAPLPLRLAQARAAMFYVDIVPGSYASLRATQASLNGMVVTCVLLARLSAPLKTSGSRVWKESEACVEPTSGLLMTYSPVPGLYIQYDYSTPIHFHDKIVPSKFTIAEAGRTVLEARTDAISDPPKLEATPIDTSRLTPLGAGRLEDPPWDVGTFGVVSARGTATRQFVIVNAMLSSDGEVLEPEIIATSDASLNQQALERVIASGSHWTYPIQQPGVTPKSHEIYCKVEFLTAVH